MGSPARHAFGMKAWFRHRSAVPPRKPAGGSPDGPEPLARAERACCCPARPVVTVVMPPTSARPHPVDLLLCGHHYGVCRAAVTAAGAAVYDELGTLIRTGAGEHERSVAGSPIPRSEVDASAGLRVVGTSARFPLVGCKLMISRLRRKYASRCWR